MPRWLAPSPERAPLTHERTIYDSRHRLATHGREPQARNVSGIAARRQRLLVLAVEVGGRWNADSQALVRQLVQVRALRAPPALGAAASTVCTRRWWGMLSTAVQHAVAARPWEHRGWSPKAPLGASLPWTTCWRSLSQLARVASHCAKRGLAHHDEPHYSATRLRTADCFSEREGFEHSGPGTSRFRVRG